MDVFLVERDLFNSMELGHEVKIDLRIDGNELCSGAVCLLIFFFQAEDGIRDLTVTGVQTCALPIFLTSTGFDGLFNTYAVTDVNWIVASGDQELRVTGSGTYKVGGEFAVQQELALVLKIGDDPVQHFDSGLVSGGEKLPDISVTISMHGQVCFDIVFFVDASPVPADQIHSYKLVPESTFQQGCFPPCDCPLGMPRPLSGTFALVDLRQGPLFTEFAVVNVFWLVAEAPDGTGIPVRGVGTYRVGGEFAVQQQLSLDLWVGDEGPTHFDS